MSEALSTPGSSLVKIFGWPFCMNGSSQSRLCGSFFRSQP
jgi:hypothetical protein